MALTGNDQASPQARAMAALKLEQLRAWAASAESGKNSEERAHLYFAATRIAQFQKDPKVIPLPAPAQPPDGPPIGDDEEAWLP